MMRIANDGLPFDIDYIVYDLPKDSVEIIQYLHPYGKRRRMACTVGEELARKANSLILSAELLGYEQAAIYGRKKGEPEEDEVCMIADNFQSEKSTVNVLKEMIETVSGRSA